jgi:hypothetical protein
MGSVGSIVSAILTIIVLTPGIFLYTNFMSRHFPIYAEVEDVEGFRRKRHKFVLRGLLGMEALFVVLILLVV